MYVQDEKSIWLKIILEDIYYIETIKSTHYCRVVYKEGVGKIHADITPLQEKIASSLFRSKASTLVNLSLVQKVDTKNRILYFQDNIFCTYTQRVARELKMMLRLYSYRNYGGFEHE